MSLLELGKEIILVTYKSNLKKMRLLWLKVRRDTVHHEKEGIELDGSMVAGVDQETESHQV